MLKGILTIPGDACSIPTDWSFNNVPASTITDRGFTGHEHLDIFRLINMNGRLYDPVTGRFLNADPVIDNTGGAQGLNSYSYCLNNPLKFTDPSGYKKAPTPEAMVVVNANWLKYAGYEHYSSPWFNHEFGESSGGGGGGGIYGKPGQGGNGTGLGGIYYDNVSGNYRDVNTYKAVDQEVFDNVIGYYRDVASQEAITTVWGPAGNSLGETVNNFLGIEGLTCNDLYWWSKKDGSGWGGLKIDLSYTSNDPKTGYKWIQMYSENGGSWTFDNKYTDWNGTHNSGSIAYYSPEELAKHINGNTISFSDAPRSPANNDSFRFALSLYNGSDLVFLIYYGYDNINGITTPNYPKSVYP